MTRTPTIRPGAWFVTIEIAHASGPVRPALDPVDSAEDAHDTYALYSRMQERNPDGYLDVAIYHVDEHGNLIRQDPEQVARQAQDELDVVTVEEASA